MSGPSDSDNTLNITKEMDIQTRIQDVAKKLCVHNNELWQPTIDPNKPGGLTDEEKKQLTLEEEASKTNQTEYINHVTEMYNELSSIGYTLTTK